MDIWQKILTKDEINTRFNHAVNAILANKLVASKASLAESLGVKPAKFSEILNGRMKAGVDMISIMCDLYNISPDWLLMSRGNNLFRDSELPDYKVDDEKWDRSPCHSSESNNDGKQHETSNHSESPLVDMIREKDALITQQAETIGSLKERIRQLEREKGKDVSDVLTSGVANVG